MAPIHIEIQGRPKDQIEQWLLTVPEPEGNNYDNLINHGATTTAQRHGYSKSKASKHRLQRHRSSDDVLKEVHHRQPPIEKAKPSEESQSVIKRKRSPPLDIMSNCSTTKRGFKKFGRRPRNKTREDKYEPKKKKEKSATATAAKSQKKSQDDVQKTKASKRLTRRSTTSIESNFKPANIAQGRLTLNNSLGKGFFARSKTSHSVGRLGLPDLSFTDMGFLSKSTRDRHSELPSLAAYDDKSKSPASTARRSVSKSISRFFSGPQTQKLADNNESSHTTHHRSSESRSTDIFNSQRPSITPFKTPSNHHQRGHHALPKAKASHHPSNCSEAQDDKNERTPLRSDSATVVYSWSPTVASSTKSKQQIGQRLSIKASPTQVRNHRSSEKATRSTTRSTPSLNSSLLSKTRKKLFQNVFIGEKDTTRRLADGKVTCTLEQLQKLSRRLSEEPCRDHDVADFSELEKSPREDNGNDHELGVEKLPSSGDSQLKGPMNLSEDEPEYRESAEDEDMTGNSLQSLMKEDQCLDEDRRNMLPTHSADEINLQCRPWATKCPRDGLGSYTHPPVSIYPETQHPMSYMSNGNEANQIDRAANARFAAHSAPGYPKPYEELPYEHQLSMGGRIQLPFDEEEARITETDEVSTPVLLDSLMDVSMSPSDLQLLNRVLGEPTTCQPNVTDSMQPCNDGSSYVEEMQREAEQMCDQACCAGSEMNTHAEVVRDSAIGEPLNAPFGFWRPNKLY